MKQKQSHHKHAHQEEPQVLHCCGGHLAKVMGVKELGHLLGLTCSSVLAMGRLRLPTSWQFWPGWLLDCESIDTEEP